MKPLRSAVKVLGQQPGKRVKIIVGGRRRTAPALLTFLRNACFLTVAAKPPGPVELRSIK